MSEHTHENLPTLLVPIPESSVIDVDPPQSGDEPEADLENTISLPIEETQCLKLCGSNCQCKGIGWLEWIGIVIVFIICLPFAILYTYWECCKNSYYDYSKRKRIGIV